MEYDCDGTAEEEQEHTAQAEKAGSDENTQISAVRMEDVAALIIFWLCRLDIGADVQIRMMILNIPGAIFRREADQAYLLVETQIVLPDSDSSGSEITRIVLAVQQTGLRLILRLIFILCS